MEVETLNVVRIAVLLIFLPFLANRVYSGMLFDVYKYDTSGQSNLIGHVFMSLSNSGAMGEFQPTPRGQAILGGQNPYPTLTSISPGGYPHILIAVCSAPATKQTLSTFISFTWPLYMSSTQLLIAGQILSSPEYHCHYITNINGVSNINYRSERAHINFLVLLESLVRNAPNQAKANSFKFMLLHTSLLIQSFADIQGTGADLQITEISYHILPEGFNLITINTKTTQLK